MSENVLSERDELFAALVASGSSIRDAGAGLGLGDKQSYRTAASPAFKLRVSELRTAAMDQALGRLSEAATMAVERLKLLGECDDPSVSLRASVAILDRFTKLSEHVDVRQRLDALEAER